MVGHPRLGLAIAVLALGATGACVIDLGGLAGGGSGASTSTTSSAAGGQGTGGGDAGCPLLDCSCVKSPTVVAAQAPLADSPRAVAVTSEGVFWADEAGGAVVRAPAAGGAPQKVADAHAPRGLDVSGGRLVWTADEGVFSCTLPACGDKGQVQGAAASGSLRSVAYDGVSILWSDVGSGAGSGKVMACTLGSCSPIALQDSMMAPDGVALHDAAAFWVDRGNGNQNGSVSTSPTASAGQLQIASMLDLPTGVAADDTYVYWTESLPGGHVYRCASAGGPCSAPTDLAPAAGGFPRPHDVRLAGGRIYWTSADDGAIRSCPVSGCGSAMPTVHVTGRQAIQHLVVGTSCLFWTEDGNGGAVMRMAR